MRAVLLGAVVLLGGCETPYVFKDQGDRQAATELIAAAENSGLPPEATVSIDRERFRWRAEDWTAGPVRQIGPDFVVVESVTPGVGEVRLGLPPDVPVFDGNDLASLTKIAPGTPVRANFIDKYAAEPVLVSIELLKPTQLKHLALR